MGTPDKGRTKHKHLIASLFFLATHTPVLLAVQTEQNSPEQTINTEPDPAIEVITVKGQKRDKTLQEADIAVTVLSETDIRETRLREVRRIDDLVPNVQFNETGQLSSVFVSIRGIESNPFIVNRAAIYIDGIPFRELSNAVLNNIDSIEVLRGPQSTLYGANSEAGLILINTRQPSEFLEGQLRLTGSSYKGRQGYGVDGFISSPIIEDELNASLSFKLSEEDAFVANPASSVGEAGEIQDVFVQATATWQPNENFKLRATGYILDTDAPGLFEQEYAPLDIDLYNQTYRDAFNGGRDVGEFEFLNDTPKRTTERDVVLGLSASYQIENGTLDAALSYFDSEGDSAGLDLDLTALPTVAGRDVEDQTISSAEIRFTSPDSASFEYLVGISWYDEELTRQLGTAFGGASLDSYALSPPLFAGSEDYAVFVSLTAQLFGIEGLSGTVGLRWDRAKRNTEQQEGILDLGFAQLPFQNIILEETFNEFLPRFAISYQPSDRTHIYASAAKGYIPGGFNLAAADAEFSDEVITYDQETVYSYEVGVKRTFKHGYVNAALFYIESDNWQEVQVLFDDQGRVISTAFIAANGSIESQGFEIEGKYNINDNLKLTASIGYTDANYEDFQFSETENLAGNPVKLVPEYDANLALRYETDQGFFARGELSFLGDTPLDERSLAVRDAVVQVNLQAGYESDKYSVHLFAENLTDKRLETGLAFGNFNGDDGNLYAPIDAPRVIGVELEYHFY